MPWSNGEPNINERIAGLLRSMWDYEGPGSYSKMKPKTTPRMPGYRPVAATLPNPSPPQLGGVDTSYGVVGTGVETPKSPTGVIGATTAPPVSQAPTGQVETDPMSAYLQAMGSNIGELGALEDEQAANEDIIAQAQKDIETQFPEGRQAGRVYVAANPLEALAAGIRQYRGYDERKKGRESREGIRTRRKEERNKFGDLLAKILRGEDPTAEQPSTGFGGYRGRL